MTGFEIDAVRKALKRCYPLQECLYSKDEIVAQEALKSLSYQSGMRLEFIKLHLQEIKNL